MNENVINNIPVIPTTIRSYNGFIVENSNELKHSLEFITTLEVFGYHCYYIITEKYFTKISKEKPDYNADLIGWFFTKRKLRFIKNPDFKIDSRNAKYYAFIDGSLEITLDMHTASDIDEKMTLNDFCNTYENIIFNDTRDSDIENIDVVAKLFKSLALVYYCVPAIMCYYKGVVIEDTKNKEKLLLVKGLKDLGFNIYYIKYAPRRSMDDKKEPESLWCDTVNGNKFGWFITKDIIDFSDSKSKVLTDKNTKYFCVDAGDYVPSLNYKYAKYYTTNGMTIDEFICYSVFYNRYLDLNALNNINTAKAMSIHNRLGIVIKANKNLKIRSLQYHLLRKLCKSGMVWYTLRRKSDKKGVPCSVMRFPYGYNICGWFLSFKRLPHDFNEDICTDDNRKDNFEIELSDDNCKVFAVNKNHELDSYPFTMYRRCKESFVSIFINVL